MNSLRQLGSGILYAVVSVVLVVGGLSLALAEGGINAPPPTVKPSPTLYLPSATPTEVTPTIPVAQPSVTPQVVYVTATRSVVSPTATLRASATATRSYYYATKVPCGPYYGWIKGYIVQQGDTLFHIATLYQTTVTALQVANCNQTTYIYPGELLWVPNAPTITPGVTIIPTFATDTPIPTLPPDTPVPAMTETATTAPTDTAIPNP